MQGEFYENEALKDKIKESYVQSMILLHRLKYRIDNENAEGINIKHFNIAL